MPVTRRMPLLCNCNSLCTGIAIFQVRTKNIIAGLSLSIFGMQSALRQTALFVAIERGTISKSIPLGTCRLEIQEFGLVLARVKFSTYSLVI